MTVHSVSPVMMGSECKQDIAEIYTYIQAELIVGGPDARWVGELNENVI